MVFLSLRIVRTSTARSIWRGTRTFTAVAPEGPGQLHRSYLYGKIHIFFIVHLFTLVSVNIVPTSSDRMMEKSMSTNSDTIIYDLEDSVPPSVSDKDGARTRLQKFLTVGAISSWPLHWLIKPTRPNPRSNFPVRIVLL